MFVVGKADSIVQMALPALRFWSKMGLTPRSGPNDVTTFVLYEEGSKSIEGVEIWSKCVSSSYSVSPDHVENVIRCTFSGLGHFSRPRVTGSNHPGGPTFA